jgi:hypothetical protein
MPWVMGYGEPSYWSGGPGTPIPTKPPSSGNNGPSGGYEPTGRFHEPRIVGMGKSEPIIVKAGDTMVSIAASRGRPSSAICELAAANPHKETMPGTCQFRSLYVGEELNSPSGWPCCSGCASGHGGCGTSGPPDQEKGLGSCGGNCGQTMGSASGFGNGSPSTTNGPGSYRDGTPNYPFPRSAGSSNGSANGRTAGNSNGASSGGASGNSNGGISTTSGHSEGYNGYGGRSLVPTGGSASGSSNGSSVGANSGLQGLGDTTGAASTSYATPLIIGLAALAAGFGLAYVAMRPAKTEKEIREEIRSRR